MNTYHKIVHFGCCLPLLLLFAVIAHGADDYRFRTWVDDSGQFKIKAQYQRIKSNNVLLSKEGGGDVEIPIIKLSDRDQEYIRLTNRGMEPNADFDRIAKEQPFVIDITKNEPIYRHTVKYPWKVDKKKLLAEFAISGNGSQELLGSTKQQQPIIVGKELKFELRFAPASPKDSVTNRQFDLAGDVTTRITFDDEKKEFTLFIKPSIDVIRGRAGATKIPMSVEQCEKRVVATQQTIELFTQQIEQTLPQQISALESAHDTANRNRQSAFNAKNFQAAGVFSTQMNTLEVKWKGLTNQIKSKRSRIPALKIDQAYLNEIAIYLSDLDAITVKYRIFSKIGENKELILDAM